MFCPGSCSIKSQLVIILSDPVVNRDPSSNIIDKVDGEAKVKPSLNYDMELFFICQILTTYWESIDMKNSSFFLNYNNFYFIGIKFTEMPTNLSMGYRSEFAFYLREFSRLV